MPSPSPPIRKRLQRIESTHTVRFLTFSCFHRLPLFNNDHIKQVFVDRLTTLRHENRIELFAWVLMPEHAHLLLRPASPDQDLAPILQSLKRPVAERVLRRWRQLQAPILKHLATHSGRLAFWQPGGGYDRNLFSAASCEEKLHYIDQNPVKRGLVAKATEWKWSNARWFEVTQDSGPTIDPPLWQL